MRIVPSADAPTQHRIAYIDGLRAAAVLAVVLFHAAKWSGGLPRGVLQHTLYEGAHGVDLFFVISGFCLAYPTLSLVRANGAARFDVVRYWAHRIVRIVPPFYCALIAFAVGGVAVEAVHLATPAPAWIAPDSVIAIFRQMLFLDGAGSWTNGSFWSLALEFRWYFAFPILLWLWVRAPRAFCVAGVLSLVAYHFTLLKAWDFATLPAFMLGIVAADLFLRNAPAWRWAIPGLVGSIVASIMLEPKVPEAFAYQPQTGWQLASFFFVVTAGSLPAIRALLSLRAVVYVGLASYSIYLMHEPVIAFLESNGAAGPALAAFVGIGVGVAFWLLFERSTTNGALRRRLMEPVTAYVRRLFGWLQLPASIDVAHPSVADVRRAPEPVAAIARDADPGITLEIGGRP